MGALGTAIEPSQAVAPSGALWRGKQSGLGREGSHEGLDEYLELKYIGLPLT